MQDNEAAAYLRLSDARLEGAFDGRLDRLRRFAAQLGWVIPDHLVVVENDITDDGKVKPASASKRKRVVHSNGREKLMVVREKWDDLLGLIEDGHVTRLVAEDLDRLLRTSDDAVLLREIAYRTRLDVRCPSGRGQLTRGGTDAERDAIMHQAQGAEQYIADLKRRVRLSRNQLAGVSYGGGPRPYGYQWHAPGDPSRKYQRTLVIDEDEALVIKQIVTWVLDAGLSLNAIARELNSQGRTTARGRPWSPQSVRDAVIKPSVAAKTWRKTWVTDREEDVERELIDAPWEPILDAATWQQVVDKLTDPHRRTTPGPLPRWLLSGIATCGKCGSQKVYTVVPSKGSHAKRGRQYICRDCYGVSRDAADCDLQVRLTIIERLRRDEVALRPPVTDTDITRRLRARLKELHKKKRALAQFAGDPDFAAEARKLQRQQAEVEDKLARTHRGGDPLGDIRRRVEAGETIDAVITSMSAPQVRAAIPYLFESIVIQPLGKGRRSLAEIGTNPVGLLFNERIF